MGCKKSASPEPASVKTGAGESAPTQPANLNQTPVSNPQSTQPRAKVDACTLLTSNEIQSIQGEPVKDSKLSGRSDGGFLISQCFFGLPTFVNSAAGRKSRCRL